MKTILKTAKFTLKTAVTRCVAAKILYENGKMYAVFGGFMIDCDIFCRGCGCFNVFFRWLQGLFAVKMRCENGKSIIRKRWLGFAISVEIHCVTAVGVFVSGVFHKWFPEFHKAFHRSHIHFTANQHLISTFPIFQNRQTRTWTGENNVKNRLTHVQKRWKPHSKQQNSHSKQRLRGALRRKFCAVAAVSWLIAACSVVLAAVSMCFSGVCKVYLRRKCGAKTAKALCENGGLDLRFRLKFIVLRRLRGAFRAFPILISRISKSIPPFSPPFYSKSTPYINISNLSKPPNPHSNRRKQC